MVAQSIGDLQPLNEAHGPFRRIGQRAGEVEGIAESVRPCVAEVEVGSFDGGVVAEDCRAFETELYKFLENSRPAILTGIREKKVIDDALKADLIAAINEVKSRLGQTRKAALAGARA